MKRSLNTFPLLFCLEQHTHFASRHLLSVARRIEVVFRFLEWAAIFSLLL